MGGPQNGSWYRYLSQCVRPRIHSLLLSSLRLGRPHKRHLYCLLLLVVKMAGLPKVTLTSDEDAKQKRPQAKAQPVRASGAHLSGGEVTGGSQLHQVPGSQMMLGGERSSLNPKPPSPAGSCGIRAPSSRPAFQVGSALRWPHLPTLEAARRVGVVARPPCGWGT